MLALCLTMGSVISIAGSLIAKRCLNSDINWISEGWDHQVLYDKGGVFQLSSQKNFKNDFQKHGQIPLLEGLSRWVSLK